MNTTAQKPIRANAARVQRFRRKLTELRRDTLLNNVDLFLEMMDRSRATGNRKALAWAEARWNSCWDEIDRRDRVPGSESAA